jgi:hypothetical protein
MLSCTEGAAAFTREEQGISLTARVGLRVHRVLACRPLEFTRLDHNTTHAGAVAANPLGQGMADDIWQPGTQRIA